MTDPHRTALARLSAELAMISERLARTAAELTALDQQLSHQPPMPATGYAPYGYAPAHPLPPPPPPPPSPPPPPRLTQPPPQPPAASPQRSSGWVGKALAVAGVAVTLVGVALLLALAAQAGILRPEFRVAAGGLFAVLLVAVAWWLHDRPGGRVGAIALAATGIAAAYIDVIAATTIYQWVPAPAGLVIAGVIGGGGLTLARFWNSEALGLLVLIPLTVLAPIVTDGDLVLLVAFMLTLSAASLPVQLGKDWIWLHAARIAAATLPLLMALVFATRDAGDELWLVGAVGIGAALAIGGALILLPGTTNRVFLGLLTAPGVLPVWGVSAAVDRLVAALVIAALAGALLSVVLLGDRLPGITGPVRQIWGALSGISALIAVAVAFDSQVTAPVLLAMAAVLAVAGRRLQVARWMAIGYVIVGGGLYLGYAPPSSLVYATDVSTPDAVSILIASVLLIAAMGAITWAWRAADAAADAVSVLSAVTAAVIAYAVTAFTVTAGVLFGGENGGFFAGHMAATICWIGIAAALFGYAAHLARNDRTLPITGGLAFVAAAMGKLFLFDLGTLDGMFRVAVFIVVGLVLLAMGTGYARMLDKQDQQM